MAGAQADGSEHRGVGIGDHGTGIAGMGDCAQRIARHILRLNGEIDVSIRIAGIEHARGGVGGSAYPIEGGAVAVDRDHTAIDVQGFRGHHAHRHGVACDGNRRVLMAAADADTAEVWGLSVHPEIDISTDGGITQIGCHPHMDRTVDAAIAAAEVDGRGGQADPVGIVIPSLNRVIECLTAVIPRCETIVISHTQGQLRRRTRAHIHSDCLIETQGHADRIAHIQGAENGIIVTQREALNFGGRGGRIDIQIAHHHVAECGRGVARHVADAAARIRQANRRA